MRLSRLFGIALILAGCGVGVAVQAQDATVAPEAAAPETSMEIAPSDEMPPADAAEPDASLPIAPAAEAPAPDIVETTEDGATIRTEMIDEDTATDPQQPFQPPSARMEEMPVVELQSLNKITARTVRFEADVGSTLRYGSLYIKIQACRKSPPLDTPESAAFLQVWEQADDKESKWVFSGWMFASSPALSAMNHPIYDVWVIDCKAARTHKDKQPDTAPEVPVPPAESEKIKAEPLKP